MSDWKKYYQEHLTTAAEAVKHIKSGNRVVFAHACGEPSHLVNAMGSIVSRNMWKTFGTTRYLSAEAHAKRLLQGVRIIHRVSFLKFPGCSVPHYRLMLQW